jgi:dihydrofolate reductase
MIVSLIVAMDRKRGIGRDNALPWRLSADLKRFRELTMGHHIVLGRKTYESIGKPLPGRTMIIVTRNVAFSAEGSFVVHSLDQALALAEARGETEVFICGGAEIYAQALPHADRLYLTEVDAEVAADAYFPAFNADEWREGSSETWLADEKNQYSSTFRVLQRK